MQNFQTTQGVLIPVNCTSKIVWLPILANEPNFMGSYFLYMKSFICQLGVCSCNKFVFWFLIATIAIIVAIKKIDNWSTAWECSNYFDKFFCCWSSIQASKYNYRTAWEHKKIFVTEHMTSHPAYRVWNAPFQPFIKATLSWQSSIRRGAMREP